MDLQLINISKFFGTFKAVDQVTFSADKGELFSLVGPSGCGKTTLLRMIAGFYTPEEGQIMLSGRDVSKVPVNKRSTAMVFQNYALFPHMTVKENIAFGLSTSFNKKMKQLSKEEINRRVQETLELIRLPDIGNKIPKELSGGMQQRVALGRAIVIHPDVLLLDEPLSNLDAKLREELRMEIREIQQRVGITTIFVTHDISEAFAMSDRIGVMQKGKLIQIANPVSLYENPINEFVGSFVGKANIVKGFVKRIEHNTIYAEIDDGVVLAVNHNRTQVSEGSWINILIRPGKILLETQKTDKVNSFEAKISRAYYLGNNSYYEVYLGNIKFVVDMANNCGNCVYNTDDMVYAEWSLDDSIYYSTVK